MAEEEPLVAQAKRRLGTVLREKYTVDRVLGVGGMAIVYAATHRNKKQVAIKMLHPELSIHDDVRKRFLREGYVANSVGHKGSVDVIDDDIAEDGAAFLVMELLDGSPVDALAIQRGGILPVPAAVAIAFELCGVLAAAHAKGIVHRDIKPANLFVTRDGELKVLDFGIARLRDTTSGQATNTGVMMGTPAYMSPEQAMGQTGDIGAATDIYAAGATLFTLLTGTTVHEGDNAQQLVIRTATMPARAIESVLPSLPETVARIVNKALQFRTSDRWESASAMRAALRAAYQTVAGEPIGPNVLSALVGGPRKNSSAPAPAFAPTTAAPLSGGVQTTASPTSQSFSDVVPPRRSTGMIAALGVVALAVLVAAVFGVRSLTGSASSGAGLVSGATSSIAPADSASSARAAPDVAAASASTTAIAAAAVATASSVAVSEPTSSKKSTQSAPATKAAPSVTVKTITLPAAPSASATVAPAHPIDLGSVR
jgi:serine/threonine-protein kinase